jgi:hypothetical protein
MKKRLGIIVLILTAVSALFLVTACPTDENGTIAVTDISLDKTSVTIMVGLTEKLTASIEPADATDTSISWSSDDENVATVDSDGTVTAVKLGTATVSVTTADGGFTADCAVTVLLSNGKVRDYQKLSNTQGNFTGTLSDYVYFGSSITSIGDLDGDGITDLVVGGYGDSDGGSMRGAVWVLFMNSDGTVKSHQKISDTQGDFGGNLTYLDNFGWSLTSPGDLDGDGTADLAVGAIGDSDNGDDRGAVWVLFINSDGTVKSYQKINDAEGNFTGTLEDYDEFGSSVTSPGDLDGDGVNELVVGARGDNDGVNDKGAVWVLFMNTDGTVKSHQKISDTQGNFTGTLAEDDQFGTSVTSPGDLDGDGVNDLVAGASEDDGGGSIRGAVWVLFMNTNGTVKSHQKIGEGNGNFTGNLSDNDRFGFSVTSPGDLDGDLVSDLAVGAWGDNDGGNDHGAVWVLFMNTDGTVKSHQKISDTQGNFTGTLSDDDRFGRAVASPGDLDEDGIADLVVGAQGDDDGGSACGAAWVLFLDKAD